MGYSVFPAPSSGPSLAEITTAIQTNASPIPSYQNIVNGVSISGVTSYTVTGLSSYKFLRIYVFGTMPASAGDVYLRYNSDTTAKYSQWDEVAASPTRTTFHEIGAFATSGDRWIRVDVENNAMYKLALNNSGTRPALRNLLYESSTVISSITILNERTTNFGSNSILYVQGVL